VPAVWDSLSRIETANRWSVSVALAGALVDSLERSAPVDSLELAHALLYVANGMIKQRLYRDGVGFGSLERAIGIRERQAGPGDSLAVWAHLLAATFYPEAGKPELARSHGEIALDRLQNSGNPEVSWLSQAHLGLATALTALRAYDLARPEYEAALQLREEADGPECRLLVPPLAEYGVLLARIGEFDEARVRLQRAVRIAEIDAGIRGVPSDLLSGALSRLSTLENRVGNVAESLELAQRAYEQAVLVFGEGSIPAVRMKTIVSYRLLSLGDWGGGAALLEEIVPAMEAGLGPDHPHTINARLSLLEALVEIGDTTAAERELAVARSTLEAQDPLANSNWTYFLQLVAACETACGRTEAARETLLTAIDIERRKEDPVGERMGELLVHSFDTMQGPADRPLVERTAAASEDLAHSTAVRGTEIWGSLVAAQAAAEARAGMRDLAWKHALEAEDLGRERLAYEILALPDPRALQLASELGKPCELLVALLPAGNGRDVAVAWDRIAHWRGLVGYEVSRCRAPGIAATDTAVAAAHTRWISSQRKLAQLVVSGAAHPDDPDTHDLFETARRNAEEMERRYVRLASVKAAPGDSVHLETLLAHLEPDEALVAFAVGAPIHGETTLGAFVVTGTDPRPRWIDLGPLRPAETEVGAWLGSMGTPYASPDEGGSAEEECRELGTRVRAHLWDPVAEYLENARAVYVVPEGIVNEVPWLALPEPGDMYLADGARTIRVLQAERDLLPGATAPLGRGLLAVGGPDFDAGGEPRPGDPSTSPGTPRAWRCTGMESLSLSPLPEARAEAEDIVAEWPEPEKALLLEGPEADEATFKQAAHGQAVIHLATHGVIVDESCGGTGPGLRGVGGIDPVEGNSPSASAVAVAGGPSQGAVRPGLSRRIWLAFAGANRPPEEAFDENEGLLTAEEVATLDLRGTDWVVLSACQTGVAPSWTREGVLGMRRAFHLAGARAVIASQWSVGDESTREWMQALYAARASGASGAGAAVGDACRRLLSERRAGGRSTHPFYWAAFTASGD